jgi:glycine betaine/proline transport system permease protein
MEWLDRFPTLDDLSDGSLLELRRGVDIAFREFTRAYGAPIEAFFDPLRRFLLLTERLLVETPWPITMAAIGFVAWAVSRSFRIAAGTLLILVLIGLFGMWEDTMRTVSMILVAALLAVVIGIPIGIAMSRSDRLRAVVSPLLDVMQTMPSFVYLIPVVMLLGIGRVPGLIAVVIYALPPIIRLTDLGIRLVDRDVLEAALAYGASGWQRLRKVELPLALPTIMAGVNQTIMMALAMVVIASMIGVQGLGQPVLRAINNQYFTMGILNGLAIVGIAIVFDRISQALGRRLQRHREAVRAR